MKIMAVDLGDSRTGLAVCDRTEFLASPVGVIEEKDPQQLLMKVAAAAQEFDVGEVVIGLPINMDGSEGPRAQKAIAFAHALNEMIDQPVNLYDERQTTMLADRLLNEAHIKKGRKKGIIDEAAATMILESYLAFRKNQRS